MKWLKTRAMWAHGYNDWKYKPLYVNKATKAVKNFVVALVEQLAEENEWSEKFRRIEWEIINTKQVPNKHIKSATADLKSKIVNYRIWINQSKGKLIALKALKAKGRKTCPDEIKHKKRRKAMDESLAKSRAKAEARNDKIKPCGAF